MMYAVVKMFKSLTGLDKLGIILQLTGCLMFLIIIIIRGLICMQ
jgi:hypothetical protein